MESNIIDEATRNKEKAQIFLKNKTQIFLVDINRSYFFSEIQSIDDDYVYLVDFTGKRKGEENKILWLDIIKLVEYNGELKDGD